MQTVVVLLSFLKYMGRRSNNRFLEGFQILEIQSFADCKILGRSLQSSPFLFHFPPIGTHSILGPTRMSIPHLKKEGFTLCLINQLFLKGCKVELKLVSFSWKTENLRDLE